MYKSLIAILCLMCLLGSCKKDEKFSEISVCESSDPMQQVKWLKEMVESHEVLCIVSLYEYKGSLLVDVYPTISSCLFCHFYTCEGERYDFGPDGLDSNGLVKIATIWPKEE